jgi:hypothetical protein
MKNKIYGSYKHDQHRKQQDLGKQMAAKCKKQGRCPKCTLVPPCKHFDADSSPVRRSVERAPLRSLSPDAHHYNGNDSIDSLNEPSDWLNVEDSKLINASIQKRFN